MKLKVYIKKSKTFFAKTQDLQELINNALFILESFGIPVDGTARRIERMAIVFLAVADVKKNDDFDVAKDLNTDNYALKTRDIITYVNKHFQETISSGSYDDIRRKDLQYLLAGNVILRSSPKSATNDSTRGYVLNPFYANLLRTYLTDKQWEITIHKKLAAIQSLSEKLKRERTIEKIPVLLFTGNKLELSVGKHNELQKAIVEQFLPRYGYNAELLYLGDTSNKYLFLNKEKLQQLNFFEILHDELPDIIAFSEERNWLYLIEAVHSSGAINELRLLQLQKLTQKCTAEIIFVTAFLEKTTFRKFVADIAWETEVWIADNPDHLIHFNGDKFLGPYPKT